MKCDICSRQGAGQAVTSYSMRNAVSNGFNPYALRLTADPMGHQAEYMPMFFSNWKAQLEHDTTNWNLCSSCLSRVADYVD